VPDATLTNYSAIADPIEEDDIEDVSANDTAATGEASFVKRLTPPIIGGHTSSAFSPANRYQVYDMDAGRRQLSPPRELLLPPKALPLLGDTPLSAISVTPLATTLNDDSRFDSTADATTLDLKFNAVPIDTTELSPLRRSLTDSHVSFAATSTPVADRQPSVAMSQTLGTTLLFPPSPAGTGEGAPRKGGAAFILSRIQAARDSLVLEKTLRA
jgi:hypothetical protein